MKIGSLYKKFSIFLAIAIGILIDIKPQSLTWQEIGVNKQPERDGAGIATTGVGRIDYIAFDPHNSNRMFAASPWGGLFISDNQGESWYSAGFEYVNVSPEPGISCIFIDPIDEYSNTWYVATGNADHTVITGHWHSLGRKSYGLYRTTNGGETWVSIGPLQGIDVPSTPITYIADGETIELGFLINDIIQIPDSRQHLIVSTSCGIYETQNALSTDPTWTKLIDGNFLNVLLKPDEPFKIYCSEQFKTSAKVYGYDLNTSAKTEVNTGIPITFGGARIIIRFSKYDPHHLFIIVQAYDGDQNHARVSRYDFTTHQTVQKGMFDFGGTPRPEAIYIGNGSADIVYAPNGIGLPRIAVNGLDANDLIFNPFGNLNSHCDQHYFIEYPDHNYWVANDGGVYKYTGDEIVEKNNGLCVSTAYYLSVNKNDPDIYMAGYQDCGVMVSRNNEEDWDAAAVLSGDGSRTLIDHRIDGRFYGRTNGGFFRLNQIAPHDYEYSNIGYPNAYGIEFDYSSIEDIFHASPVGLKKYIPEIDQNVTWSKIPFADDLQGVYGVSASPTDPNHIYISAYMPGVKKIYKSETGGGADVSEWTEIGTSASAPSSLNGYTSGTIDFDNPDHIWLVENPSVTLYSVDTKSDTWIDIDVSDMSTNIINPETNLPKEIMLTGIIGHEYNSNQAIYVGTNTGIYYTDLTMCNAIMSSVNWVNITGNLPNCRITDFKINNGQQEIVASAFGRGIWKAPLYCSALPGNYNTPTHVTNQSKHYEGTITADGQISGLVTLMAGDEIVMEPGFETLTGADFTAITRPCGSAGSIPFKSTSAPIGYYLKIDDIDYDSENNKSTDITGLEPNNEFLIWPNPTNGVFYLETIDDNAEWNITVVNIFGTRIINSIFTGRFSEFDLSGYPKGVYFVNLKSGTKAFSTRLIVQ